MSVYQFLEKIDQEKKDYLSVSTRASEESKMVEHCLHSTLAMMYLLTIHFLST